MNTDSRSPLLSLLRRTGHLVLLAGLVFSVLPVSSASAYYNEGTQVPGQVQYSSSGGSGPSVERRCGSINGPDGQGPHYWRREGNGRWRVELLNYPYCTGKFTAVVNTSTNDTRIFDVDRQPGDDWTSSGHHLYCVKYVEVLRFYGPDNDPARYITRSVAYPHVPCAQTGGFNAAFSRFGFMAPHPHDAYVHPSTSFFQSTGTYATTKPLADAWQPQGAIGSTGTHCPLPDDNSNLRRFFATDWSTEEEAQLARTFRENMYNVYRQLLTRVRRAGLPDHVAAGIFNVPANRPTTQIDGRTTVSYSDGIPCSSPLDFTVGAGQRPWVYGYCAAPVVTSYRGPLWVDVDGGSWDYQGIAEKYPDAWDTNPNRAGSYGRHLPDYSLETAHAYFAASGTSPAPSSDRIVQAYRQRAASVLGRTDQFQFSVNPNVVGRASQMAANLPCAYGYGPVEPTQTVVTAREPVDRPTINGPRDALAYVGGVRTQQTFTFRPGALTCNGGQGCTQGQYISRVNYRSPQVSVPSGWTACNASNRATCNYEMSWRQNGQALEVTLRTYTATRPGESIRITPRGDFEITWPELLTEAGELTFSIAHTTSGFSSSLGLETTITIPFVPDYISATETMNATAEGMGVAVAGSRLNTYR